MKKEREKDTNKGALIQIYINIRGSLYTKDKNIYIYNFVQTRAKQRVGKETVEEKSPQIMQMKEDNYPLQIGRNLSRLIHLNSIKNKNKQ